MSKNGKEHFRAPGTCRIQLNQRTNLEELRSLATEQEEQIGILAHDLKSLLGGINLSAKICGDRLSGGKGERSAGVAAIIAASSARLLEFVQGFLVANARNSNDGHGSDVLKNCDGGSALKAAHDRLIKLTAERNKLLNSLAREFEIRLATLRYNASSLRDQTQAMGDARATLMAENIAQATSQLFEYVGRFLDKAGGKHLALRPGLMSLRRAVTRTMDWYLEPARAKEVQLLLDAPDEEEGVVVADEQGVNRVLDNLLSNAIKFSPPRTTVRLSIHSDSRLVQCRIADQGPGFTATDKARMFERYSRLSARPTGEEASTGLGLSIVRKLARAMGGDVICQSIPGCGAAFTVGFPRPSIGLTAP
ncbi:MAG TPA: HAMP domain-containing sensor histidine kinase [Verrucomicrobiae bacterium]|jgi:signal transduction histidine kinase